MGALAQLALSTGMSVAGEIGKELGYGIGNLTGYNQRLAADQYEQQKKLTGLQYDSNLALMKESYAQQKAMWDATQAEAQVKHLKNAGLNPALIYASGGAGGSTAGGGSASVGGGSASSEADRQMAANATLGMGLQLQKLASEIDVNKSVAEVNRAQAGKAGEETKTIERSRGWLIQKLVEDGQAQWLENVATRYKMGDKGENEYHKMKFDDPNFNYGDVTIKDDSLFTQEVATSILKAESEAGNAQANAALTNEKAQGYFKELLNDTIRADAAGTQAAASKLSAEFQTGEYTNWKTWADLAKTIVETLLKAK